MSVMDPASIGTSEDCFSLIRCFPSLTEQTQRPESVSCHSTSTDVPLRSGRPLRPTTTALIPGAIAGGAGMNEENSQVRGGCWVILWIADQFGHLSIVDCRPIWTPEYYNYQLQLPTPTTNSNYPFFCLYSNDWIFQSLELMSRYDEVLNLCDLNSIAISDNNTDLLRSQIIIQDCDTK